MLLNFLKKVLDIKERTNDIDLFTIAAQELKIKTERHQQENDLYVTDYEKNKMNTLKEFGLVNSEFVVNTESDISKIEKIQRLKEVIKYFNRQYPNNPFILYSQAKKFVRTIILFSVQLHYIQKIFLMVILVASKILN